MGSDRTLLFDVETVVVYPNTTLLEKGSRLNKSRQDVAVLRLISALEFSVLPNMCVACLNLSAPEVLAWLQQFAGKLYSAPPSFPGPSTPG